jgi:hypothetical protein
MKDPVRFFDLIGIQKLSWFIFCRSDSDRAAVGRARFRRRCKAEPHTQLIGADRAAGERREQDASGSRAEFAAPCCRPIRSKSASADTATLTGSVCEP